MPAVYTADFETCDNRAQTADGTPTFARVWLWAVCDIESHAIEYGTDIESFISSLYARPGVYWFHNLSYDGTYIVDYCLRNGWEFAATPSQDKQFCTVISDKGKWYALELVCGKEHIHIYDSLKKYPFSVKVMGQTFGFPEEKGTIDYRMWRGLGYIPTQDEYGYIANDVLICARAMGQAYSEGATKLTIGSDCMAAYKKDLGKRAFKRMFPRLNDIQDRDIRRAYRGGYCRVEPRFKGKDVGPGISVDFNSMYPSMMMLKPFPYGQPVYFTGRYEQDDDCPLYVQTLTATFHVKPSGFPMVQIKGTGFFGGREYVEHAPEPVTLTLSSVDLELFMDCYDVDVKEWRGGYKFHARVGMFSDYMAYWRSIKQESKGIVRTRAKLYLNNLYGKFGTNPNATQKLPLLEGEGPVRYVTGPEDTRPPVYVPVAVFATAWARDTLIRAAMANRERFVYCDTDSLHLIGTEPPAGCPLDDNMFGHWKVEGTFTRARHLRTKCYMWDLNGETSVTCAGMPENIKSACTWENFHIGLTNYDTVEVGGRRVLNIRDGLGKLQPLLVEGGRTLVERPFSLR